MALDLFTEETWVTVDVCQVLNFGIAIQPRMGQADKLPGKRHDECHKLLQWLLLGLLKLLVFSWNLLVLYQLFHLGRIAPILATVCVLMVLGQMLYILKLRGTTLVAPLIWAILSTMAITTGALVASNIWAGGDAAAQTTWRYYQPVILYASACTSFCPIMAILGAKRPQNGPWQWIVLSLWIVLVLPALQFILLPSGPRFEPFTAWKIFLIGLMSLGLLNWLPTKYWLASCCFSAGQLALFWESLTGTPAVDSHSLGTSLTWFVLGSFLFFVAFILVTLISVFSMKGDFPDGSTLEGPDHQDDLGPLNKRWLAFRDRYGSFWGLRILQRFNQTAAISQWPVRLQWQGFEASNPLNPTNRHMVTPAQFREIERALNNLLRRFF